MSLDLVHNVLSAEVDWRRPDPKLAAIILAYHADESGVCVMSIPEMAERMPSGHKRASEALHALVDMGVVNKLGTSRYGFHMAIREGYSWTGLST